MPARFRSVLAFAFYAALSTAIAAAEARLPSPRETWVRMETAHFTLYGNSSESKMREIGLDLERLRAVLLKMTDKLSANAPVPTSVYVFKSDASLEPYKPVAGGKTRNVGAYFQSSVDGNFIALSAAWNTDPRRVVYHEYLHFFLQNNFKPQPRWYDEGAAEFYSTFRATDREARIGEPVEEHVRLLREIGFMPLERLFAVGYESPEYNEESRQGQFYAQSWAFVHYLMRGEHERKGQLGKFLIALQNGRPVEEAFRASFQTDYRQLLSEVVRYVNGNRFFYTLAKFSELNVPSETKASKMSREEALVRLGELLARLSPERLGDAESHFRAVLSAEPSHAGAFAGMGDVRMRQENLEEAAELYRRAMEAGSDDFRVPFHYGSLLMRLAWARKPAPTDAEWRRISEEARAAFSRSVERNGEFPEARAALGRTYLAEAGPAAAPGIPHLEAAKLRLPSRTDVAMDLAELYERVGQEARGDTLRTEALGPEGKRMVEGKKKTREFERSLERVNQLFANRKDDEAIVLLERLVAESSGEVRAELEGQLEALRRGAARNRAVRRYNDAIAKVGREDFEGALIDFEEAARTAEDLTLAASAREQAEKIRRYLGSKKRTRPQSMKDR